MSGSTTSKHQAVFHRFPSREVDTAIEILGTFITSGLRDEIEALRQEVEVLKELVENSGQDQEKVEECYLNQRQAAEFLGCSTTYIRKQRQDGDFPEPVRLSDRDLRWAKSALTRWAEERQGEGGRGA